MVINGIGVGPKPEYICGQVRDNMDKSLKQTIDGIRRDLLLVGLNDLKTTISFK